MTPTHFVSASCQGEVCFLCASASTPSLVDIPATHKVGEEIPSDDPNPMRHNLTAYVCCAHFRMLFGSIVPCRDRDEEVEPPGHKAHCF